MSAIAMRDSVVESFQSDDSWPGTRKFHQADIPRLPPPNKPWPILKYFHQRGEYQDQALLFCRICCSGKAATSDFLPGILPQCGQNSQLHELLKAHMYMCHGVAERKPTVDELQRQISDSFLENHEEG